jgi:hypothetical protein
MFQRPATHIPFANSTREVLHSFCHKFLFGVRGGGVWVRECFGAFAFGCAWVRLGARWVWVRLRLRVRWVCGGYGGVITTGMDERSVRPCPFYLFTFFYSSIFYFYFSIFYFYFSVCIFLFAQWRRRRRKMVTNETVSFCTYSYFLSASSILAKVSDSLKLPGMNFSPITCSYNSM